MKQFRLLFGVAISIFPFLGYCMEPAGPGWQQPDGPVAFLTTNESPASPNQSIAQKGVMAAAAFGGEPVIAEYITPEITALAQGLQNDPKQIFDYVHNTIHYVHYFGSKKGAYVTLLERSGNDFDQCALLVALLRAAKANNPAATYTVSYEFGCMKMPYQAASGPDLRKWLGFTLVQTTSPDNWLDVATMLNRMNYWRGYPKLGSNYQLAILNDHNNFAFHRVWVKLVDGANTYYLDPGLKISTVVPGLDVTAAMQFNLGTLLSGATTGATINQNYVKSLNYTQIKTALGTYTANLLSDLTSATHKNLSVEEVIGGYRVAETETTTLPTTLAFQVLDGDINSTPDGLVNIPKQAWDNIPASYLSKIRLQVDNVDVTYDLPALRGRKLSLTFVSSQAKIWLEDILDKSGSGGSGLNATMQTTILHPFGVWNYSTQGIDNTGRYDQTDKKPDGSLLNYQRASLGYVVVYGFDDPNGRVLKHQEQLEAYLRQGLTSTDPKVATEILEILGLSWAQQSHLATSALGAQKDMLTFVHHRGGRAGAETGTQLGYYVDLALIYTASIWRAGIQSDPANPELNVFEVGLNMSSALEHGIIEQLEENAAASTMKCLNVANANGKKIIRATSANWSTVQSYLNAEPSTEQYTTAQRNALLAILNAGSVLLMPSNAKNPVGANWKGFGYVDRHDFGGGNVRIGMIISGGYAGGFAGTQIAVSPVIPSYNYATTPTLFNLTPPSLPSYFSWDPVNMADGSFTLETADLATGQPEPRGFSFSRHYSSSRRYYDQASMARGWTHNYIINAAERSDPLAGLGKNTPLEMASMIVGLRAAYEVYTRPPDATYPDVALKSIAALISEWSIDRLTNNAVNITLGSKSVQFIKQPTGASSVTYVAPAGVTMTLTKPTNYILQQRHGNTLNFDVKKRLSTIVDPYGKTMTFAYLTDGRLDLITDSFSRQLDFEYNPSPDNRLKWIDDNDGSTDQRRVSFTYGTTYSSQGDLLSVTDTEGKISSFEYDTEHKLLKTKDAMATPRTIVQNIYDGFGRVTEQRCEGDPNRAWKLSYAGFSSVEEDPQGGRKTYYYDEKHRAIGTKDALENRSRTDYDGQDHVIRQVTPKGEIKTFAYDGLHNLTQVTEATGVAGVERSSYCYYEDTAKHLTRVTDYRGQDTFYVYNAQHQVTSVTLPNVNSTLANVVKSGYFATDSATGRAGNTDWMEDQEGNRVYFQYDTKGQMTRRMLPDDGDAGTLDYEVFVNNYRGDVTSVTDFRNNATTYVYNNRRQVTTKTEPGSIVTQFTYDNAGNLWKTTDPKGYVTEQTYSATGKPLLTRLPELPGTIIPEIENHYDSRYWLDWSENPLNQRTKIAYNVAGQIIGNTDPLERTVSYGYDPNGQKTTVTSSLAIDPVQTTTFTFNARGENTFLADAMSPGNVISYEYDANSNPFKVINRNNGSFVSTYYSNNQLQTFKTPLLKTTTTTYKPRGMVDTVTEPSTQQTVFGYDNRGRLNTVTDGVTGATPANFTYDANGNLLTHVEGTQTITRGYDNLNRVTSYSYVDTANTARNYALGYQYDNNNNLTQITYPGGKTVNYVYDSNNRLYTVTDWGNRMTTYTYDLAGRVKETLRPGGTKRKNTYNDAGETTLIEELAANGNYINYFKFTYDTGGRMQHEFIAPVPAPFTEPAHAIVPNADNQIMTFDGQTVVHDADGNMTSGPLNSSALVTYTYNSRNLLTGAGNVTYTYDPEGNRITITQSGQTIFAMDSGNVLVRTRPDGTKTFYVYGHGLLYDVEATTAGVETGVRHNYHYDYRGSTTATSDGAGNVFERIEYGLYGKITRRVGITVDTPFLYNGGQGVQTDPNSLLYMRARYYNPYLCRFINSDPAGFSGGMNFYAYANGNPVSMSDPSGLGAASHEASPNDYVANYNTMQAQVAAAWNVQSGSSSSSSTGQGLLSTVLDFVPGGLLVKAFYTSSTGKELGSGGYYQGSDLALLGQGVVGAVTVFPAMTAASRALAPLRAEYQIASAVRASFTGAAETTAAQGTQLYRVFGNEARGLGNYYTTVNPGTVADFRTTAGLFPGNSGSFVLEGTLNNTEGVIFRSAAPGPGGVGGGLPEVFVPNPATQININRVSGVNPPF